MVTTALVALRGLVLRKVVSYVSESEYVATQELTLTGAGLNLTTVDKPEIKTAIRSAIAEQFGVTPAAVEIISITEISARRVRRQLHFWRQD